MDSLRSDALAAELDDVRCQRVTTAVSEPHRLVRAFYEDIWNRYDKSVIPVLLDSGFSFRGSFGQLHHGHAGFAEYVDFVHTALGNYRCDIQEIIAEGSKAFARMLFSGIHRGEFLNYSPTFKRVEWAGAAVFSFGGGKITDLWVLGDLHGLMQQLERNART